MYKCQHVKASSPHTAYTKHESNERDNFQKTAKVGILHLKESIFSKRKCLTFAFDIIITYICARFVHEEHVQYHSNTHSGADWI